MKWIKDEEFIRGNVPMTKFDARMLTIALLRIEEGDLFLDIGGGTGSISIEAALQGGKVFTIERDKEAIDVIAENAKKFNVRVELINSCAPMGMEKLPIFDKIFIGGSGGNLEEILNCAHGKLKVGGILTSNFITLDNMYLFSQFLKINKYTNIERRLIQSSVMDEGTGLLKAQNPIFIFKGEKI